VKYIVGVTTLALVLLGVAVWAWVDLQHWAATPADPGAPLQTVQVAAGSGVGTVAEQLHRRGIIRQPWRFKLLARLNRSEARIQAGEYSLSGAQSPSEVLTALVSGRVELHAVTIPEGYTARQIAGILEQADLVAADAFLAVALDAGNARRLGVNAESLEGYLFPDTYYFPRPSTAETVARAMVARFRNAFRPEWEDRAKALGFTVHQIVTLASIVEKETGDPDERPLIASVLHNRLKRRMRLEMDPTVIYGIPDFDGNLTREHLRTPTPYNTYVIRGLPPGPIANPGLKAIEAVLYPADTDYLFFVSKRNHTHHFSSTISEHNRAVRRYQLRHR